MKKKNLKIKSFIDKFNFLLISLDVVKTIIINEIKILIKVHR